MIVIEYNLTGSIHNVMSHKDSIHTVIDLQEKELLPSTAFTFCLNPCYDLYFHGQTIHNTEQIY